MKIHFIGHASIIAECRDTSILMDPWLFGKVFNNSWSLIPEPRLDKSLLDKVDYLWISHEHPDHCHFPSLDSFPTDFKERVTILFQDRDYEKVFAELRQLGYRKFKLLPHRKLVRLGDGPGLASTVYCYHAGLMDSALAVMSGDATIFNVNDARISTGECSVIRKDIGHVDLCLNQFSLAAYAGFEPHARYLKERARNILEDVSALHRGLRADATIPFASFIYFSNVDNKYVNPFANTVRDTYRYLAEHGQKAIVMYPGDTYEVGARHDSSVALNKYDAIPSIDDRPYDLIESKPLSEIAAAYDELAEQIRERYPGIGMLRPVTIRIPDLDRTVQFKLSHGTLHEVSNALEPTLVINSQPLWFCFKYPFGVQTLGVSARFRLMRGFANWKAHRLLFSLNNSGVYLRPKYLLTSEMISYCRRRLTGGLRQSIHYYRTSL